MDRRRRKYITSQSPDNMLQLPCFERRVCFRFRHNASLISARWWRLVPGESLFSIELVMDFLLTAALAVAKIVGIASTPVKNGAGTLW